NPADTRAIEDLRFVTRFDIEPVIVGEYTLRKHIERYYETSDERLNEILNEIAEDEVEVVDEGDDEVSVAALQAQIDSVPVVKLITGLLTDAVLRGASDIHIEANEHEIRVRYRIDGALREVMKPPLKMKAALTSRIKSLANL